MDMTIFGQAAIIGSITVPAAALLITVVKTKSFNKGRGAEKQEQHEVCPLHSGVDEKLKVICQQQEEMRKDIKELLKRHNGVVGL